RVARGALEGELEHAEELLPLALDLGPGRVGPEAEDVEGVVADLLQGPGRAGGSGVSPDVTGRCCHQRTPESYPSFLLWAVTGRSLHSSSTMGRRAAWSPRSTALRPSRTRAWARIMSVAWSASEAARWKRRSQALGSRW